MANDSQRDKARAIFGKTFFENSKALPNPKNAAAALQKRANDRPIPTYKVGGVVKKNTPPQPTAAEREASRRYREELAKMKVTKEQGETINRGNRAAAIEGGRYKDGGKAMAGAKRAMKAEQDFTGLMKDAAARAAAKGTPVMKQGGATDEYTAKRVMSRIKAGNFKDGGRAELLRDRRMKDIEKDFKIALAKGKNEGVAKAKYEQRMADAADDYAKRTGADRTKTRAAEKAAEVNLTKTRKYGAMKTVTTEAPESKVMDSLGAMAAPKMDSSIGKAPAKAPKRAPAARTATPARTARAATPAAAPARAATPAVTPTRAPAATAAPTRAVAAARTPAPTAARAPAASPAKKQVDSIANRVAAMFTPEQMARRDAAYAERQQARGYPAVAPKPAVFKPKPAAVAPNPTAAKKPVDSIANRVAAMFTPEAMAERNSEFAKRQKAKGYAAGGAGKVRKGMMKGK